MLCSFCLTLWPSPNPYFIDQRGLAQTYLLDLTNAIVLGSIALTYSTNWQSTFEINANRRQVIQHLTSPRWNFISRNSSPLCGFNFISDDIVVKRAAFEYFSSLVKLHGVLENDDIGDTHKVS